MYRSLLYKKIGNMILSRLAFKVAVILTDKMSVELRGSF